MVNKNTTVIVGSPTIWTEKLSPVAIAVIEAPGAKKLREDLMSYANS